MLEFLDDKVPEVRAAAINALGYLVKNRSEYNEHATTVYHILLYFNISLAFNFFHLFFKLWSFKIDHYICDRLSTKCTFDGAVLVRAELVVALQWFIIDFENRFANLVMDLIEKTETNLDSSSRRKLSV